MSSSNQTSFQPSDLDWQVGCARTAAEIATRMGLHLGELRSLIGGARTFLRDRPQISNAAVAAVRRAFDGVTKRELELSELADFHELSRRHVGVLRLRHDPFDEARDWWRGALLECLRESDLMAGSVWFRAGAWFAQSEGAPILLDGSPRAMGPFELEARSPAGTSLSGPLQKLIVRWPFELGEVVFEIDAPIAGSKTWIVRATLRSEGVQRALLELNGVGTTLGVDVQAEVLAPAPFHGEWPCVLQWRTSEGDWHEQRATLKVRDAREEGRK